MTYEDVVVAAARAVAMSVKPSDPGTTHEDDLVVNFALVDVLLDALTDLDEETGARVQDSLVERLESGPVRFGDDWPGFFIRGDQALALRMQLDELCSRVEGMQDLPGTAELIVGILRTFAAHLGDVDIEKKKWM